MREAKMRWKMPETAQIEGIHLPRMGKAEMRDARCRMRDNRNVAHRPFNAKAQRHEVAKETNTIDCACRCEFWVKKRPVIPDDSAKLRLKKARLAPGRKNRIITA